MGDEKISTPLQQVLACSCLLALIPKIKKTNSFFKKEKKKKETKILHIPSMLRMEGKRDMCF